MKIRTALLAGAIVAAFMPAHAASATDNGPTPSDVVPINRTTGKQPDTRNRDTTVDAAHPTVVRDFAVHPAGQTYNYFEAQFTIDQVNDSSHGTASINSFYIDGGSDYGGYIQLQTQLYQPNVGYVGKGVVFSLWKASNGTTSGCTQACTLVTGSEVGQPFVSIHMPYQWVIGHVYQVEVRRLPYTPDYIIWQGFLYDLTTGTTTGLGQLYTSSTTGGGVGGFSNYAIQWLEEYYPSSYPSCSAIAVYRSSFWSSVWLATGPGANYAPTNSTPAVSHTEFGCSNSGYTAGAWPAGWPDPLYAMVIGATS